MVKLQIDPILLMAIVGTCMILASATLWWIAGRSWSKARRLIVLALAWVVFAGAVIQSGATTDTWTIDPTSKAGRITLYDTRGNSMGQKATYRAATADTLTTAASTAPFAEICGSGTKTVRIQWIRITGPTTATLAIQGFTLKKNSTATTGGTITNLTQVPLDSNNAAGTLGAARVFTAAPTAGTVVGSIASVRSLNKSTTAVDGAPMEDRIFDFRTGQESEAIVLRGAAQCITAHLHVATITTVSFHTEWTEE